MPWNGGTGMSVEIAEGVIDGSAVELVQYQPPPTPSTLFHTDDPVEVIAKASLVANALKNVIVQQRLAKSISGRDHVLVEGWTTLGSMLGVIPVVVWSRRVEPPVEYTVTVKAKNGNVSTFPVSGYDWEARVEARTLDGRVVGGAEAMCSRNEHTWAKRDDYALRSMAQTRATSKALRGPLGFVVTLAGFAATPAEEMPVEAEANRPATPPAPAVPTLTVAQRERVMKAIKDSGKSVPMILTAAGVEDHDAMTAGDAKNIKAVLDELTK